MDAANRKHAANELGRTVRDSASAGTNTIGGGHKRSNTRGGGASTRRLAQVVTDALTGSTVAVRSPSAAARRHDRPRWRVLRVGVAGAVLGVAAIPVLDEAPVVHAAPCSGADETDACWAGETWGTVSLSGNQPGTIITATIDLSDAGGNVLDRWVWTDSGWNPSGTSSVSITVPGEIISGSGPDWDPARIGSSSASFAASDPGSPAPPWDPRGAGGVEAPDAPGRYTPGATWTVTFRASDSEGNVTARFGGNIGYLGWSDTAVRVIESPAPMAVIDPPARFGPGEYQFSSSSVGTSLSHEWNFGDGTTARGTAAFHEYELPGSYTVTLTVTDNQFRSDSATVVVDVAAPELGLGLGFPGIDRALFGVGDEVPVRAVLSASSDGVGALSNVGFVGPPIVVTPGARLELVTGPTPPIPDDITLEPGDSMTFDFVYEARSPGALTIRSQAAATDAGGRLIETAPNEREARVGALEVTVTPDPATIELEEGGEQDGPVPEPVSVTIEVTNPFEDPVDNVTIKILDPQLVTQVLPPIGYTAFSYLVAPEPPNVGPPAPGSPADIELDAPIGPGETVTRVLDGLAMDGGKVDLAVLVTGSVAPPGGPAANVSGGGTGRVEIFTDVALAFDAELDPTSHYLISGDPWVDGGSEWKIKGEIKNRTHDKTIEIVVLPMLEGNASYGVPIPEFSNPPDEECGIGVARHLRPGEKIEFSAPVRTVLDGLTNGTVTYAPTGAIVEPDGSKTPLEPERLLVTAGSDEHRVSVDIRDRPPELPSLGGLAYTYGEAAVEEFAALVGGMAMMGIQATAFALQPWEWAPAYQAAGDKTALYLQHVYENLSPADKQAWSESYWTMVQWATGMALSDARDLANQMALESFTELEEAVYRGDSDAVAAWWGKQTGAAPDLALGALTKAYGACKLIAKSTPWARNALVAKEARIAAELDALGSGVNAVNYPTGAFIGRANRRAIWGIDDLMDRKVQAFVDEFKIAIGVRRRGPGSLAKIEGGTHVPKPFHLKAKNVSRTDIDWLGFPNDLDTVMIMEPPPFSKVVDDLNAAGASDDLRAQVLSRHKTRMEEWWGKGADLETGQGGNLAKSERIKWAEYNRPLGQGGGIKVPADGQPLDYTTNVRNARSLPPDREIYRRAEFSIGDAPGRCPPACGRSALISKIKHGDDFLPVTGDMDALVVTKADLSHLPEAKRIEFYERAHELGFEHVESASWNDPAGRNGYLRDHSIRNPNAEAIFTWMPNSVPRATRFDPRMSWVFHENERTYGAMFLRGMNVVIKSEDPSLGPLPVGDPAEPGGYTSPRTIYFVDANCNAGSPPTERLVESGPGCEVVFDRGPGASVLRQRDDGTIERYTQARGWAPFDFVSTGTLPVLPQTVVSEPAEAGANRAEIIGPDLIGADPTADEWFEVGDLVLIDPGGPNEETAIISGFGSLVFEQPLANAHAPGEVVSLLAPPADPSIIPPADPSIIPAADPSIIPATGNQIRVTLSIASLAVAVGLLARRFGRGDRRSTEGSYVH